MDDKDEVHIQPEKLPIEPPDIKAGMTKKQIDDLSESYNKLVREHTLTMPKKDFADFVFELFDDLGERKFKDHPARFFRDFSYDLYRGECRSHASKLLAAWSPRYIPEFNQPEVAN